ncbi:MAG: tRNA lysidine(34) synthetase TilS [Christensenellales bacterium]
MVLDLAGVIEKSRLIADGQSVLCAVSGGPDSMALLFALYEGAKKHGYKLFAGHVNHQLRVNAIEDEQLVENFCRRLNIPFLSMKRDVRREAAFNGKSLEEAARDARYECLEAMRTHCNAQAIALAHQKGDQAETVLFRLLRGSGMKGLCGMRPRSGCLIRPFLSVTKKDILDYVACHHIPFCTDETNADQSYTRNYLRLTVLPALACINPNAEDALCRTASLALDDEIYLEEQAASLLQAAHLETGELSVPVLNSAPLPLVRRALRIWIARFILRDVSFDHIEGILNIASMGGEYCLPGGNRVLCSSGRMIFCQAGKDKKALQKSVPLNFSGNTYFDGAVISCSEVSSRQPCTADKTIQYFDGDHVPEDAVFRHRKNGDVITPLGMNQAKKLKDYLIDRKLPRYYRDDLPLLCSGKNVLWVVGCGISDHVKTSKDTESYLCMKYIKNDFGGNNDETIC